MPKPASKYDAAVAVRLGANVLGAMLIDNSLIDTAEGQALDEGCFLFSENEGCFPSSEHHRLILREIRRLRALDYPADIASVAAGLAGKVDVSIISELIDGVVPQNFRAYCRQLRAELSERAFALKMEALGAAKPEDRPRILQQMTEVTSDTCAVRRDWRELFHTAEEFEHTEPLSFAIEGFLQNDGVTMIGGLAGHGKTLIMLAMCKALLSGAPLFGIFPVPRPVDRVLYLVPEIPKSAFKLRMGLFGLDQYHKEGRFFCRSLNSKEPMELSDPRLLDAVAGGAHIFLDSVIRFTVGSENDSENARIFSTILFKLLDAGAGSIVGCHHSPKSFQSADYMCLENVFRGSSDFGALISTGWGVRQIDAERNRILIQCVKSRDFEACQPFVLEGRPHLDESGHFSVYARPGEALELSEYLAHKSAGRPVAANRDEQIKLAGFLRDEKKLSLREIAAKMHIGKSTVQRLLDEHDLGKNQGGNDED